MSNTISTVSLQGRHSDSPPHLLSFIRAPTAPNPLLTFRAGRPLRGTPPPPRPTITLPPPGNLNLSLRIGARIGWGGTGAVYEAFPVPGGPSSSFTCSSLPPLVVKISYRGCAKNLAHEAYYYDFCHPLQGVSIARFYGHFRVELPEDFTLVPSKSDDSVGEAVDLTPYHPEEELPATGTVTKMLKMPAVDPTQSPF